MIIKRIRLQNWKNFQDATVELTHRVFIVGPNASGKSNLLDAVRFMRDIVKKGGGFQRAVEYRGGLSRIRCVAADPTSDVALELHLAQNEDEPVHWIYRLAFNDDARFVAETERIGVTARGLEISSEAMITEEKVWRLSAGRWILDRSPDSAEEDSETIRFTHLEQPSSNKEFREIHHFFRDAAYLHVIPQLVRDTDAYHLKTGREDYYGKTLLQKIAATPEGKRKERLKTIGGVLNAFLPWCDDIEMVPDDDGEPHLRLPCEGPRESKHLQESQLSDGTLRMIGLMWALLDGKETVLLEEPELHLHTAIIRKLPEMISILQRSGQETRQVLITTHSFDLLSDDGIGADEVVILRTGADSTQIQRADNVETIKKYLDAGFSMAEAVIPETSPENVNDMLDVTGKSA